MSAKKPSTPKTYTITAEEKEFLEHQIKKQRKKQEKRHEELLRQEEKVKQDAYTSFFFAPIGTPEERAADYARNDLQFDIGMIKNHYHLLDLLKKIENKETSLELMEAQVKLMPSKFDLMEKRQAAES